MIIPRGYSQPNGRMVPNQDYGVDAMKGYNPGELPKGRRMKLPIEVVALLNHQAHPNNKGKAVCQCHGCKENYVLTYLRDGWGPDMHWPEAPKPFCGMCRKLSDIRLS